MTTEKQRRPEVVLVMKPVDGGRAMIGMIECPHCGAEHLTTNISCGERDVYCGVPKFNTNECPAVRADGYATIIVIRIV